MRSLMDGVVLLMPRARIYSNDNERKRAYYYRQNDIPYEVLGGLALRLDENKVQNIVQKSSEKSSNGNGAKIKEIHEETHTQLVSHILKVRINRGMSKERIEFLARGVVKQIYQDVCKE